MITPKNALLLSPVWFCIIILFAGAQNGGYAHNNQAISELGASGSAYASLVRFGGFVPLGLAFLAYSYDARRQSGFKRLNTPLTLLFTITGLAIIAAGIFPTDPHGRRNTFSGMAHAVAGLVLLTSICLTPLTATLQSGPKGFRWFSLVCGMALLALFALLPNGISPALIQLQKIVLNGFFDTWYKNQGLVQRGLLLVYFAWLTYFLAFTRPAEPAAATAG